MKPPTKFELMRNNRHWAEARIEEGARERSRNALLDALANPSWKPCNEGCDPEWGGSRSVHCSCEAAKAALRATLKA
jgi:hypothetical protein